MDVDRRNMLAENAEIHRQSAIVGRREHCEVCQSRGRTYRECGEPIVAMPPEEPPAERFDHE